MGFNCLFINLETECKTNAVGHRTMTHSNENGCTSAACDDSNCRKKKEVELVRRQLKWEIEAGGLS